MSDCLTDAEAQALASDAPLLRDRRAVEAHVQACSKCRSKLQHARERRDRREEIEHQESGGGSASTLTLEHRAPVREPLIEIEGYQIIERIRGGGQGVVFKAVQKSTNRLVAVKVLPHEDSASDRQKQRFEREVSLAASLRHPNIVTIYDSGLTSGRYFFAMEYVHGQPLDDAARMLKRADKLRLFAKVCDAVAHAHQQNVVHRDLKPGNILVDARGEPHILDFGLAKSAGGAAAMLAGPAGGAPLTLTSQFMGTLAYASPEQTLGDPMLVDRRSDVYALGVILFELLTGAYPYPMTGDLVATFESIRHAPPRAPSQALGNRSMGSTIGPAGEGRGIDRDLDTIVLRALAKEPPRRYQSAEELAGDIHRYLAGEPIAARRDSAGYVMRIKTRAALRRHPALTLIAVIALAGLLASNLASLLSKSWAWPARWYEQAAAGDLIGAALEPRAFENVRVLAITDDTTERVHDLARALNIEGVDRQQWWTLRRLHGRLMERLAGAGVRAVVWDLAFDQPQEPDAAFVAGVEALQRSGVGVAVAVNDWIVNDAGEPVMSPAILRSGVLWGGVTMDIDERSVWKMDLLVKKPDQPAISSIALAGLCAWRRPGLDMRAALDASAERIEIEYRDPASTVRQTAVATERIATSAVRRPRLDEVEDFGLTNDSLIALYAVRLPEPAALDAVTRPYHHMLLASDDELREWCEGRLIVIGDQRPEGGDLHEVPGRASVYGSHVQAATIDALIRNALPARYPGLLAHGMLAVIGAAAGGLAAWRFRQAPLWRGALAIAVVAGLVVLCIVAFRVSTYLCHPLGPVLGFGLAFAAWLWFDLLYSHQRTEAQPTRRFAL